MGIVPTWCAAAFVAVTTLVPAAPASAERPTATLIGVHEMHQARAKGSGTANCSPDDPGAYANVTVATGWLVAGATTAHLNPATVPGALGDVSDELQAGFDAWLGGSVPRITVATDGTATRYSATRTNDLMFGRSGSSIATTYTWRWNDGLVESDVVFNKGFGWFNASSEGTGCWTSAGAKFDVRNIATHEFGHVYGLDHPAGARYETMYAYGFTGETLKWSPTSGELSGIASMY
jgi:hypothetical protein